MIKKLLQLSMCYVLTSSFCYAASLQLENKISGVQGPVLDNIQQRLDIAQQDYGKELTLLEIQSYFRNAPKNIQHAMQPYGYFRARVQSRLAHQGNHWYAIFNIQPGPQLHITSLEINIEGPCENNPAIIKFVKNFPVKVGQVFKADAYDQAKESLFQVANEQGYLKATLEKKEVRIDLKKYRADISLQLNTGPRYYFGKVKFNQNTFSESFLRRFMSFKEGEPFSSQKLLKFQSNLSSSNYFKNISVTPLLQQPKDQMVPVDVGLIPSKSQQYNIGVGYGTFTGPRVTLGANFRHLTNMGHHVDMQMKLSPVLSGLAAQYVIPGENPLTDQYTIGASAQKFSPKNGKSISGTVSVGAIKQFGDWKRTLNLAYLWERYNISPQPFRNSGLLIPSVEFSRVKADDLLHPRFGSKFSIVVRGASRQLISTTNFVQTEIKGKYIFSPTQLSRVIVGGDFGYTVVRDLDSLPLSLQFFGGGLDSIRGFPFSYFGPGRYLKVASFEFQHRIYGKLNGAVFYDIGTADNHLNAPMGRGRGVGLIYDSVVGPIKMYVGYGYLKNKPRRFDLELSIGPDL